MRSEIKKLSDVQALSRAAAEMFISIGVEAIKKNNRFTVALAGGSTPKSVYRLLTTTEFKSRIDLKKTFFFFGDERDVSPDSDESNFRMASENLLKPLQIPEKNVFRWKTELGNAEKIAESYEKVIKEFFNLPKNEFPRFDLILLGMGDDGHTASLFPFTEALKETEKIAVANWVEKLNTNRLTLTFPAINNASNVIFLVSGAAKAETLREVLERDFLPDEFPSQKVRSNDGNLIWLVEKEAAGLLK